MTVLSSAGERDSSPVPGGTLVDKSPRSDAPDSTNTTSGLRQDPTILPPETRFYLDRAPPSTTSEAVEAATPLFGTEPGTDRAGDETLAPEVPSATAKPPVEGTGFPDRSPAGAAARGERTKMALQTAMPATVSPSQPPPQALKTGDIPGYELLGLLGRGGMGVVHKARQVRLNRLVALKMMLPGANAGGEECIRFRREAEAVARLQHPHIVQIYEIGEHEGQPYFSLELVEGGSLEKKLTGSPQPVRPAAELVEKLARAVHVAHRVGIIHRDLKPANILLQKKVEVAIPNPKSETEGSAQNSELGVGSWDFEPKVTDFGLAKDLNGQDGQTQTGAIMGTPCYMAPEQAGGRSKELGPAADIYALGSILYDLLTGRPPFRGETVLDTLQQVQSLEPVPPVRLQPTVPRDLETICLKCLQKEPHKRYTTALELADDLRCFLERRPIAARPIGVVGRGLKWARRRPAAAALVVVSVAAVLSLGVGGLLFAQQERRRASEAVALHQEAEENARLARQQEQLARRERAWAEQEQQRAESNFKYARAAVDEMLTRVSQEDLAHEPRMEKVRRDLLHKALHFYERFIQEQTDDAEVRWEAGRAQQRVGDIQEMLGQHEPAVRAYRAAASILGQLATLDPQQPDYRQDLAVTQNNLAIVLQAAGRPAEAEEAYRQALAAKSKLVADFPHVPAYRRELAGSYNNRGLLLQTQNQPTAAEDAYRQALGLFEKLIQEHPQEPDYQQEFARTCSNLGVLMQTVRRPREAEQAYRQAANAQARLAAQFPADAARRKEQGRTLFNLGVLLQLNGERTKAEETYRQAAAIFVRLSDEFPSVADYRHELAVSYNNLGNLLRDLRRSQEAEECWRKAHELLVKLAAEVPGVPSYRQELARNLNEQGIVLASTGQQKQAEKAWRQALALQAALAGDFPREAIYRQELARSHGNLGILMAQSNQLAGAEENYRTAIQLLTEIATQFPNAASYAEELILHESNLANLLGAVGRKRDAEKCWRTVIARRQELVTAFPKIPTYANDLAKTQDTVATLLLEQHETGQACELLRAAVHQQLQALAAGANAAYRESLCSYYLRLAEAELAREDAAAAARALADSLTAAPVNWLKYHHAARLLAACAGQAKEDARAPAEARQRHCRDYSDQAVAALRKALASGFKDIQFLTTTAEFDVLHSRQDFKQLVSQLESKTSPSAP